MKTTFAHRLTARAAASLLVASVVLAAAPASPVAAAGEPVSRTAPAVIGSVGSNAVIRARVGAWTNSPTSYGYQWYACTSRQVRPSDTLPASCTAIVGETTSLLRITRAFIDEYASPRAYFMVGITATNASASTVKFSKSTVDYVR